MEENQDAKCTDLIAAIKRINENILKINFKECFQELPLNDAKVLRIQMRVIESIRDAFLTEFNLILKEACVSKKFDMLKRLEPNISWRPPGDPHDHLRSARIEIKKRQLKETKFIIDHKSRNLNNLKIQLTPCLEATNSLTELEQNILTTQESFKRNVLENMNRLPRRGYKFEPFRILTTKWF